MQEAQTFTIAPYVCHTALMLPFGLNPVPSLNVA